MKRILLFLIITYAFSQDWFITNYEYGKMLYHNPRGISCAKCHGEKAKGKIIAKYYVTKKHKNGTVEKILKVVKAPNIQNVSYDELKERLLHYKYLSVMPKYNYLTKEEIEALYLYIHAQKDKK
ncbi:c-type cytochrome [Caminibacter pacificus]|jgi:cytochrome c peroxidase|nr:cytochrome c [Caminibacter pacificus]NPA87659.1 cytochrome c [Campylobacterota bacterium]QCI27927.1 cytochrome c [Caminibacter pacificus]